jgi:two-component system phosphate regulon sensor histidine kinase PhoR
MRYRFRQYLPALSFASLWILTCLLSLGSVFIAFLSGIRIYGLLIYFALAGLFLWWLFRYFYHYPLVKLRKELQQLHRYNPSTGDVVRDIDESIQELKAVHRKEIEKLKEIETFRREFLGNVSHELKTPIFAIQGFLETLIDGAMDDPEVNKKFLEKAAKHANRLNNLVKDLLVISQLETGQLQMNMEDFRIHDLVLEVFEALDYKLTRKGRAITLKIHPNEFSHLKVHADRERIRQVLINLVDNAIKYGEKKGVVTIEILRHNGNKVFVSVINEGVGIPAEHIPRLFERFYRIDKSRSREKGGTGLGLAIVKHLIEAHKEKISVESHSEKGSIFTFSLALSA